MRMLHGTILAVAVAAFAVSAAFADADIYGNAITYESDGVTVKYRFWYANQTAETMSAADSAFSSASPSADFEPRYLTWAASDGRCHTRGLHIIIR